MLYDIVSLRFLLYANPILYSYFVNLMRNADQLEALLARDGLASSKHEQMHNINFLKGVKIDLFLREHGYVTS